MLWGRKETIIWPPHGPINTYGAVLLSIAAAALFIYLHFSFGLTPLQQYYLPYYVRTAMAGTMHKGDKLTSSSPIVNNTETHSRIARGKGCHSGPLRSTKGKPLPLTNISSRHGRRVPVRLLRQRKVSYPNKALNTYLRERGLWRRKLARFVPRAAACLAWRHVAPAPYRSARTSSAASK